MQQATTSENNSCAQLVIQNLLQRENQIHALFSDVNADDWGDDPALSIDTVQFTKVCLSYGGPADYLEIYHSQGTIERLVYRYSDWFDTATTSVESDSPLWDYAQNIVDGLDA